MNGPDPSLGEARAVAEALVGASVEIRHLLAGGRNSRIYRVCSGEGNFALKQYPPRTDDPRDRLGTEVRALRLMERHGLDTVPRVVGIDGDRGYALLSWIEGTQVGEVSDTDIDAAITFLAAIHTMRATPWAHEQPLAAEACLCGSEIERQIAGRLTRLQGLADEHELNDFLAGTFVPTANVEVAKAKAAIASAGLDFTVELPQEWRSLVPSDFGFHNTLRRKDGSLAFVDFEYFGWDDPVKLTADILLHPGNALASQQRRRLRQAAVRLYGADRHFESRLAALLPLFGLRWVLILLNEFIPERWRQRLLAGATDSWGEAKTCQLGRAKEFLASLSLKVEA